MILSRILLLISYLFSPISRKLNMRYPLPYCIPSDISIMVEDDRRPTVEMFVMHYQKLMENSPNNAAEYADKFKNLVYMEEATNAKRLIDYNLDNVLIIPNMEDQTFVLVRFSFKIFWLIKFFL